MQPLKSHALPSLTTPPERIKHTSRYTLTPCTEENKSAGLRNCLCVGATKTRGKFMASYEERTARRSNRRRRTIHRCKDSSTKRKRTTRREIYRGVLLFRLKNAVGSVVNCSTGFRLRLCYILTGCNILWF